MARTSWKVIPRNSGVDTDRTSPAERQQRVCGGDSRTLPAGRCRLPADRQPGAGEAPRLSACASHLMPTFEYMFHAKSRMPPAGASGPAARGRPVATVGHSSVHQFPHDADRGGDARLAGLNGERFHRHCPLHLRHRDRRLEAGVLGEGQDPAQAGAGEGGIVLGGGAGILPGGLPGRARRPRDRRSRGSARSAGRRRRRQQRPRQ